MPKVSVIIPNYNHSAYLMERIESVLNQTYQDFEVIILDDCSTDSSRDIIELYRDHKKVSQIIYNERNSGSAFKQWLKGIELAKGDYIWIAESDDVAELNFLEILIGVSSISENNIALAFSNLDFIDKDSIVKSNCPLVTYQPQPIVDGCYFIKHNLFYGCHILNASSVIFKRSAALKVSNDFISFKGAGDYLFWIEIARQGNVYKETKILDHFRQHDKKVTPNSVASGEQFKEVYRIYNHLVKLGYLKGVSRLQVVGFWLHRIEQERPNLKNTDIYLQCTDLWTKETKYPKIAKVLYLINGIIRRSKKVFFGYGR